MARTDPKPADELTSLTQFLDSHRAIFVNKAAGLDAEQLAARPIPSSAMTLGGMIKHLAVVEDSWFQDDLLANGLGEPWASAPWDDDRDWEWHSAVHDTPDELLALYDEACARSRAAVDSLGGNLDHLSAAVDERTGGHYSLRWILLHMIEETAQHNGHADLMREAIDGGTGG
ncbi:MAG: DinB family protein [Acidimicrobiia bacterium]|nr:DinB family protein [Acidimicrobiia bacterium]